MTQYFEIRNAPKNGNVIAIWRKENDNHHLIFGARDVVFPPENEDDKRTYGTQDGKAIEDTLLYKINEAEFSVRDELLEIPHIISDGVLHHLGVLKWHHQWSSFVLGQGYIPCSGTVYAKVIDLDAPNVLEEAQKISSLDAPDTH